jgi:putative redox protein
LIDRQHHITTDEPERLGGEGCGPAPHELLPAALASCIAATLGAYGRTKDWALGDVAVDVEYDNKSVPRHFDISVRVTGDLDDAQLSRLREGRRRMSAAPRARGGIRIRRTAESRDSRGADARA